MRPLSLRLTALTVLATLFSAPANAQERQVAIYNWFDYIGETTLADFEKATGIKPIYDVYESNEVLEAKILTPGASYDVIHPTMEPFLTRMIKAGAVQKLDKSKIPNLANLDPKILERLAAEADPGNQYGVPYQWGTNGFGYNVAKIKERMPDAPVDSWALVFDPANAARFADCGIAFLDSESEMFPVVIQYLGGNPNAYTEEDLKKAEEHMKLLAPHVRRFQGGQSIDDLANGDICIAVTYSGDVAQAASRAAEAGKGVEIAYTIPKEGTLLWFDMMAIPAGARNVAEAHEYINFVLQPQVMAGISNFVQYPNAVPASKEFLDAEVRDNPSIYPSDEVMQKLFVATTAPDSYIRQRTRAWTRVKGTR